MTAEVVMPVTNQMGRAASLSTALSQASSHGHLFRKIRAECPTCSWGLAGISACMVPLGARLTVAPGRETESNLRVASGVTTAATAAIQREADAAKNAAHRDLLQDMFPVEQHGAGRAALLDGPGELSIAQKPRHDNDKADFRYRPLLMRSWIPAHGNACNLRQDSLSW